MCGYYGDSITQRAAHVNISERGYGPIIDAGLRLWYAGHMDNRPQAESEPIRNRAAGRPVQLTVRLSHFASAVADRLAERHGLTRSGAIEYALRATGRAELEREA